MASTGGSVCGWAVQWYDAEAMTSPTNRILRTTLNLRADLLSEVEAELGTTSHTAAVNAALEEYVASRRLRQLLHMDLPDLTLEAVEEMRQPRRFAAG
jgi:Arc/MetJ family transcription regulator